MREMTDYQKAEWARLSAMIEHTKREAEAASPFKIGQLVRVCRSLGATLKPHPTGPDDVLIPYPHDHSDPEQHFYSRVMGWDCLGRIEVATSYGDNPHCGEWCWSEDKLVPRYGPDWAEGSKFKPDMVVYYTWDDDRDFFKIRPGMEIEAIIEMPHIQPGDWRVRYDNTSSGYITRVLNEKQMRLTRSNLPRPPAR